MQGQRHTSGLGDQIWGCHHNAQEGAALEGLIMPDALLLGHFNGQAEPALAPALAVPLGQHALRSMHSESNPQLPPMLIHSGIAFVGLSSQL